LKVTEKVEWEVVDAPSPESNSHQRQPHTHKHLLEALLGRWWRWKIAGVATVAILALVFFFTLASIFILVVPAIAVLSLGISKLGQWLRREQRSSSLDKSHHWSVRKDK
jgi:hypothetical protein